MRYSMEEMMCKIALQNVITGRVGYDERHGN